MALIKPFQGLRPKNEFAADVAELPYDVVSPSEARDISRNRKNSFYHVTKPEIDLPDGIDLYSEPVYASGAESLKRLIKEGVLTQDSRPKFYLYTQIMEGRQQTGLVACVKIDDYLNNIVKKHELTREDKEKDRTRHTNILNANTGPVFLLYREDGSRKSLFDIAMEIEPVYHFTTDDGISHILRVIEDRELIEKLQSAFLNENLYIADGHHRAAAGVRVGMERRQKLGGHFTGDEEFNWFLAVIFPHDQLKILPYNRVVKDLHGHSKMEFLEKIATRFTLVKNAPESPEHLHSFSMYISGEWLSLTPKFPIPDDPIDSLDVKILQDHVLGPILGILDPRKDQRIDFIGGIRGTAELERLVDSGKFEVAFSLYPTTVEQLIRVSDSDRIMPPKSTWFEPKLRDGLVIHIL